MATLAPQFGISDVALKKRCKKLGIPTPPRGYWARIEAGQHPRKPKLPETTPDPPVRQRKPKEFVYFQADGDYSLCKPHSITEAARKDFRERTYSRYDQLTARGASGNHRVSKESVQRALWILDHLLKESESRGLKVVGRDPYPGGLFLLKGGEEAEICITERVRRIANPDYDPKRQVSWPDRNDPWTHKSCGLLRIRARFLLGPDAEWTDEMTNSLDVRLSEIVDGICGGLDKSIEWRDRHRLERLAEEERCQEAQARAAAQQAEQERRRELEVMARSTAASSEVSGFADAVEAAVRLRGVNPDSHSEVARWLRWARDHARRLDAVEETVSALLDR